MTSKWTRRLKIVRVIGIALLLVSVIGVVLEYHNISRCSLAQVRSGCGFALNVEGVGLSFIFAGAVLIIGSFALNAFINDDTNQK